MVDSLPVPRATTFRHQTQMTGVRVALVIVEQRTASVWLRHGPTRAAPPDRAASPKLNPDAYAEWTFRDLAAALAGAEIRPVKIRGNMFVRAVDVTDALTERDNEGEWLSARPRSPARSLSVTRMRVTGMCSGWGGRQGGPQGGREFPPTASLAKLPRITSTNTVQGGESQDPRNRQNRPKPGMRGVSRRLPPHPDAPSRPQPALLQRVVGRRSA